MYTRSNASRTRRWGSRHGEADGACAGGGWRLLPGHDLLFPSYDCPDSKRAEHGRPSRSSRLPAQSDQGKDGGTSVVIGSPAPLAPCAEESAAGAPVHSCIRRLQMDRHRIVNSCSYPGLLQDTPHSITLGCAHYVQVIDVKAVRSLQRQS